MKFELTRNFVLDERRLPVEEIRTEDIERESLPSSLLSLHGSSRMPGQKAGTKVIEVYNFLRQRTHDMRSETLFGSSD